ncbi:hypothetical protein [Nocardia asiatica]|uniref:hypothetical protein n=1 Tax=Nocardia asiatica TaxID=209252 RepID=UPI0003012AAA|nr:hypothetical protein [Nocardia asiatica]
MELTYTAEWIEHGNSTRSHTLAVGDYTAHVYSYPGREGWVWYARWIGLADDPDHDEFEEIGRDSAGDSGDARTAAEAAIRQHHAQRFA